MKKHLLTKLFFILLSSILIINSCTKLDTRPIVDDNAIKNAESWYKIQSAHKSSIAKSTQGVATKKLDLTPDWSRAYQGKLSNGSSAVIIPIPEYRLGNKDKAVLRTFIFTMKNDKVETGRIVEIYGSKDFVAVSTEKLILNHQNKAIQNFDGAIISYDIKYQYVDGYAYKDGKLTATRVQISNSPINTSIDGISATKGSKGRIVSGSRTKWEPGCTDWYMVEYWPTYQIWEYMFTICSDGGNPPPGGGTPTQGTIAEDPGEKYELTSDADSIDIDDRLDCFNTIPSNANTVYTVRICTDIPNNSHPRALLDASFSPGHTFIELSKTTGGSTAVETIGFYPEKYNKAAVGLPVNGVVVDNKNHAYDASYTVTVNATQFANMINTAKSVAANDYDMRDYNCTNFALDIFAQSGASLSVPNTIGDGSGNNYGKTPNGVYEAIKTKYLNSTAGTMVAAGTGRVSTICP